MNVSTISRTVPQFRNVRFFLLMTVFCVPFVFGCHSAKPKGFPAVYPIQITVQKGGEPMEDVDLTLIADQQNVAWSISGRTGSNGVAQLLTSQGNYSKEGAPSGSFRVTCRKNIEPIEELPGHDVETLPPQEKAEYMAKVAADRQARKEIIEESTPAIFGSVKETPILIELSKDSKTVTIDLNDYL